jgi:capsular exopolysaccharide synthesis family protein
MSRIHDALKKAAEEKASREHANLSQDFLDLTGRAPVGAAVEAAKPAKAAAGVKTPLSMRAEELLQNCSHLQWKLNSYVNVFENEETNRAGAECFRTLRSRLYQIADTRTLKRILITSSVPAEGKTFVATNLALSIIRQQNRRVLLIDADLRVSRLHLALGAPSAPGLTEYLRGEANECTVIQRGMDGLYFIPSGDEAPNPSELLLSERLKRLLDFVTPLFDFVILDSPPAIPVHDPSLLAGLCDGTLLVVRAGNTHFEVAAKVSAEFENKNLLGVVLNRVERDATYGRYYTSYYGRSDK